MDQLVRVELRQLSGLQEGSDEEGAVLDFSSGVYNFLQVKSTSILLKDTFEDNLVGFRCIFFLVLALHHFPPDFVRLLQRIYLMVLAGVRKTSWTQALDYNHDLDAEATPKHGQSLFELSLDNNVKTAVTILEALERVALLDLAQKKISVEGDAEVAHLMQVIDV